MNESRSIETPDPSCRDCGGFLQAGDSYLCKDCARQESEEAMSELKPCPFCGEEARMVYFGDGTGGKLCAIKCYACESCGPSHPEEEQQEAQEAWNLRAPDPEKQELVEALRPFATAMVEVIPAAQDSWFIWAPQSSEYETHKIAVGDLRRAATLLRRYEEEK